MAKTLYKNLLIIDIETVAVAPSYNDLNDRMKALWDKKASYLKHETETTPEELFTTRAGIYAEFGKIICIGAGFLTKNENGRLKLRVKAFANDDETILLNDFKGLIEGKSFQEEPSLVAHNGKEFDFPYICRRMLVNGIQVPKALYDKNKKPWERNLIDTMEMWKFGDYKNYTSLDLLAALFNIESSKDDIDGSMVNDIYYREKDLDRIATYCKKDVAVTAQIYLKLEGPDMLDAENIEYL